MSRREDATASVFVRPNLKWFLVGALLVAAVHQLTTAGRSQAPEFALELTETERRASDEEIERLLTHAVEHPSPETYRQIALCYEKRGEVRRALLYYKEAEKADDPLD